MCADRYHAIRYDAAGDSRSLFTPPALLGINAYIRLRASHALLMFDTALMPKLYPHSNQSPCSPKNLPCPSVFMLRYKSNTEHRNKRKSEDIQ